MGITQLPTAANNFTTIMEFNDDALNSDATYEARLTFQMIPEPSVAGLAALGGLAFLLRRGMTKSAVRRQHLAGAAEVGGELR